MALRFQHQHASALCQHSPVALPGEGEAALRREQVHCLTGQHDTVCDHAVGGADDGHIDQPVADVVAADADGMRRACAGAAGGKRRALDPILDTNVCCCRRANDARKQHGMYGALAIEKSIAACDFATDLSAGGRPNDASRAIGVLKGHLEPRLYDRFIGGGGRQPTIALRMHDALVALPVLEAPRVIEIPNLGRDPNFEVVELHTFDRSDPGSALFQGRPEISHGLTDRRYDSHTGNDDTVSGTRVCHLACFRF